MFRFPSPSRTWVNRPVSSAEQQASFCDEKSFFFNLKIGLNKQDKEKKESSEIKAIDYNRIGITDGRRLNYKGHIVYLAELDESAKLNISTLTDIWNAFRIHWKNPIDFKFLHYDRRRSQFTYDGKRWSATINQEILNYADVETKFVNIKVPLDGFIVTPYYHDPTPENPSNMKQDEDTLEFLGKLMEVVPFEQYITRVHYKPHEDRVDVSFENAAAREILTCKFELGTYDYYEKEKVFTKQELIKLVAAAKDAKEKRLALLGAK
eukprot:TRINITY_DN9805_c0_g1_i1.p1 TRINITY_DN9805_c0_g1~~TRINITY_DN9805_c0_g1_i1.p1  ORF type:complete len:265 (+),score=52.85 TRINITY_DN9805_c0_g1_i1:44-838(+)